MRHGVVLLVTGLLAGCAGPEERLTTAVRSADFEQIELARSRCFYDTTVRLNKSMPRAAANDIATAVAETCIAHESDLIRLFESRGLEPPHYQPLLTCLRGVNRYDMVLGVSRMRGQQLHYHGVTTYGGSGFSQIFEEPTCFAPDGSPSH